MCLLQPVLILGQHFVVCSHFNVSSEKTLSDSWFLSIVTVVPLLFNLGFVPKCFLDNLFPAELLLFFLNQCPRHLTQNLEVFGA